MGDEYFYQLKDFRRHQKQQFGEIVGDSSNEQVNLVQIRYVEINPEGGFAT